MLNLVLVGALVVRAQSERPVATPESVAQILTLEPPFETQQGAFPYCDSSTSYFHLASCPLEKLKKNVDDAKRSICTWAQSVKSTAETLGRPRRRTKCLFCESSFGHLFSCPLKKLIDDAERLENAARW